MEQEDKQGRKAPKIARVRTKDKKRCPICNNILQETKNYYKCYVCRDYIEKIDKDINERKEDTASCLNKNESASESIDESKNDKNE